MDLLFWFVGAMAVVFGIVSVTRRNPIYAALFLLLSMGCLAVEFLLLHAPFLAAMQILLYAGAIVVLFVFVIMLLSLKEGEMGPESDPPTKALAAVLSLFTFMLLAAPALKTSNALASRSDANGQVHPIPKEYHLREIYRVVAARAGVRQSELQADLEGHAKAVAQWSAAKHKRINKARRLASYLVMKFLPGQAVKASRDLAFGSAAALKESAQAISAAVDHADNQSVGPNPEAGHENGLAATIKAMQRTINVRAARYGSVEDLAGFLYSRYIVAFELVSVLILAAVAAVIVLARRRGFMGAELTGETQQGSMVL